MMSKYKAYIPVALIIGMFCALVFFQKDMIAYISENRTKQQSAETKNTVSDSIAKKYDYSKNGQNYDYTLLEFGSTGCHACRQMESVMEEIKTTYKEKVNVVFINVSKPENKNISEYFGIAIIPTQVLLDKNGKEYFRHSGFFSAKEITEKMDL